MLNLRNLLSDGILILSRDCHKKIVLVDFDIETGLNMFRDHFINIRTGQLIYDNRGKVLQGIGRFIKLFPTYSNGEIVGFN